MTNGLLYDLQVEVDSTPSSKILEIIEHEASPR